MIDRWELWKKEGIEGTVVRQDEKKDGKTYKKTSMEVSEGSDSNKVLRALRSYRREQEKRGVEKEMDIYRGLLE